MTDSLPTENQVVTWLRKAVSNATSTDMNIAYVPVSTARRAADDLERLRQLLQIAVDEFEVTEGRIISNSDHWTVQAREILK